jgi:hypothetical protein
MLVIRGTATAVGTIGDAMNDSIPEVGVTVRGRRTRSSTPIRSSIVKIFYWNSDTWLIDWKKRQPKE